MGLLLACHVLSEFLIADSPATRRSYLAFQPSVAWNHDDLPSRSSVVILPLRSTQRWRPKLLRRGHFVQATSRSSPGLQLAIFDNHIENEGLDQCAYFLYESEYDYAWYGSPSIPASRPVHIFLYFPHEFEPGHAFIILGICSAAVCFLPVCGCTRFRQSYTFGQFCEFLLAFKNGGKGHFLSGYILDRLIL